MKLLGHLFIFCEDDQYEDRGMFTFCGNVDISNKKGIYSSFNVYFYEREGEIKKNKLLIEFIVKEEERYNEEGKYLFYDRRGGGIVWIDGTNKPYFIKNEFDSFGFKDSVYLYIWNEAIKLRNKKLEERERIPFYSSRNYNIYFRKIEKEDRIFELDDMKVKIKRDKDFYNSNECLIIELSGENKYDHLELDISKKIICECDIDKRWGNICKCEIQTFTNMKLYIQEEKEIDIREVNIGDKEKELFMKIIEEATKYYEFIDHYMGKYSEFLIQKEFK